MFGTFCQFTVRCPWLSLLANKGEQAFRVYQERRESLGIPRFVVPTQ